MLKDYVLIIIAVILLALSFAVTKSYQNKNGSGLTESLKFNMLTGFFTAVVFFALQGFRCEISVFSLIMATASAVLCLVYTMLGFKIMENAQVAVYTFFLLTGGMAVPYIWGLLFLNEPFSPLRTVGLLIIAVSILISSGFGKGTTPKQLLLCTSVFVLNGFVSVVSKEHSISRAAVSSTDFLVLNSAIKAAICFLIYLFIKKEKGEKSKNSKINLVLMFLSALIGGGSYLLQLISAETIPATALYPFLTGGTIILTAVSGKIFFNERPDKRTIIGIVFCLIGTCMFL